MTWGPLDQKYAAIRLNSQIQNGTATLVNHLFKSKFSTDVLWNLGSLALLGASGVLINTIIAR